MTESRIRLIETNNYVVLRRYPLEGSDIVYKVYNEDNRDIGIVGISNVKLRDYIFVVYLEIESCYRGRGYGKEVVELLKDMYKVQLKGWSTYDALEFWRRLGVTILTDSIEEDLCTPFLLPVI